MQEYRSPTESYVETTWKDSQTYIIKYYRNGAFDYVASVEIKRPWFQRNKKVSYFEYSSSIDASNKYQELLKRFNQ